jgi:hypothetical protein
MSLSALVSTYKLLEKNRFYNKKNHVKINDYKLKYTQGTSTYIKNT